MAYKSKFTGRQIDDYLDSIGNKQDKLVSGTNIKTINGESILGSGNLTIESGEGGGGSSYAGNYPIVERALVSELYLEPNTYYVLESAGLGGDGTTYTTNINLVTPSNFGIVNEYVFELHGIESAISLPAYITWVNGDVPSFSAGKSYVISIVNTLAVYAEF